MSVDPETMDELLAETKSDDRALQPLRPGDVVEGEIASIAGDEILVDLGGHSAGVLSGREASAEGIGLAVGDHILAAVVQPEGHDGRAVLSVRRARNRRLWARMAELARTGDLVDADVADANRGGLVVDVGLRGFVPLSQLKSLHSLEPVGAESRSDVPEALRAYVGKRLPLKVIEADEKRDRLILSEKAAAQALRQRKKEDASQRLKEGDVLSGTVSTVTTFGLFVDVGVADGLVHRSEITWRKGVEPTSLYKPGDTVRVVVSGIDRERGRISLSIRRLREDPWARAARELQVGSETEATVTRVMPYGAFARVAADVEGLIHVSEISRERIHAPEEVLRPGDLVRVRVVAIDHSRRRLSLSMRQALGNVMYGTRSAQDASV